MSHLLGRKVEYKALDESAMPERHTGRVVHVEGRHLMVEEEQLGIVEWVDTTWAEVTFTHPTHPAGLRPVAYQWAGRKAEYHEGWLVGISGDPDASIVIVETEDGQILELDTPAVRFMDRGQGLPAADSVALALSV